MSVSNKAMEAALGSRADLLTNREKEVLTWAAAGKTSLEISVILGLTERTIKWHSAQARTTLRVATTIQAVVEALRRGLIDF